jgi:FtsP/CotA-like multicopper oxidase with cupredoxin domain
MILPRRHFLKLSTLTLAGALLPRWAFAARSGNALRIPPVLTGGKLTAAAANLQIWPGYSTVALALNGHVPGPTIRLRPGELFDMEVVNQLSGEDLVLHWHGLKAPAAFDGHPNQTVAPGVGYRVTFPILQDPAFCWYHAHTHDLTASQVYRGLAGAFIIDDPERDAALGLPTGERDVPLIIRDWKSNANQALTYNPSMFEHMWGYLGNTILVNGTPEAWLSVDQGSWRFRILNACNARVLRIAFNDMRTFHVFASDGGLTGLIEPVNQIDLSPGQRIEILVSFDDVPVGESAQLLSLFFPITAPMGGQAGPRQGDLLPIMTFHVDAAGSSSVLPTTLPAPALPDENLARRTRNFDLGVLNGQHTINNQIYELDRVDFEVTPGEVEIWQFTNRTANFHPMHIHGAFFKVLSRNGANANLPTDRGWRDTVTVYPNETVRVVIRFGPRPGLFLMHCHNLEHEHEMMQNFAVAVPQPPPLEITTEQNRVVVTWLAPSDGWVLEKSDDLGNWHATLDAAELSGHRMQWHQSAPANRQFYRLTMPETL